MQDCSVLSFGIQSHLAIVSQKNVDYNLWIYAKREWKPIQIVMAKASYFSYIDYVEHSNIENPEK